MEIRGLTVLNTENGYDVTFFDCESNNFIKIKANKEDIIVDKDPMENMMSAIDFIMKNKDKWCIIEKPWLF